MNKSILTIEELAGLIEVDEKVNLFEQKLTEALNDEKIKIVWVDGLSWSTIVKQSLPRVEMDLLNPNLRVRVEEYKVLSETVHSFKQSRNEVHIVGNGMRDSWCCEVVRKIHLDITEENVRNMYLKRMNEICIEDNKFETLEKVYKPGKSLKQIKKMFTEVILS